MMTYSQETGKLIIGYGRHSGDSSDAAIPLDIINQRHEVTKHVWRLGWPTEVSLPTGPYQVRAYLPSGEILVAQADVEGGESNEVSLEPERPSPHEGYTWAYFLKQIGALTPRLPEGKASEPKFRFTLWQGPSGPSGWSLVSTSGPARFVNIDESIQQRDPNAFVSVSLDLPTFPPRSLSDQPTTMDQYWLQVGGPEFFSQFVALPVHPGERKEVKVLVVRDVDQGLNFHDVEKPGFEFISVLVSTGNVRAEMLLGYLATGAFRLAQRVGESIVDAADEMLKTERDDPSSAAITGYYLWMAGDLNRLHGWTEDLVDWFPWMPDSRVLNAWSLMRQGEQKIDQARKRLLEAERCGLPVFTAGMRLLFDGLDFLSHRSPRDTEVAQARNRLQRYARAANWRALTTSFYVRSPFGPDLPGRTHFSARGAGLGSSPDTLQRRPQQPTPVVRPQRTRSVR